MVACIGELFLPVHVIYLLLAAEVRTAVIIDWPWGKGKGKSSFTPDIEYRRIQQAGPLCLRYHKEAARLQGVHEVSFEPARYGGYRLLAFALIHSATEAQTDHEGVTEWSKALCREFCFHRQNVMSSKTLHINFFYKNYL